MNPQPLDLEERIDYLKRKRNEAYKEGEKLPSFAQNLRNNAITLIETRIDELELIKQRIKSACEFYLRYKDKPELLIKEHPEYKKEIEGFKFIRNPYFEECVTNEHLKEGDCRNCPDFVFENCRKGEMIVNPAFKENYNEWLFKLAFKVRR